MSAEGMGVAAPDGGVGPLAGLKVLDLTRVAAGPFTTMLLGDLGADVIKVERPVIGDDSRYMDVSFTGGESGYYLGLNRNKRSIALDLKDPDDLALCKELASGADIVVENFRAGVASRLGLGYDDILPANPSVIYCSLSGRGPMDPNPSEPLYDIIGQAVTGIMHITGESDGPPAKCGAPIADLTCGGFALSGILAALFHRERTGQGQRVEVPLVAATLNLIASYLPGRSLGTEFERVGSAHNTLAPYQAFQGSDQRYFIIAVANDDFWKKAMNAMGLEELANDPRFASNAERTRRRTELAQIMQKRFSERPASHWIELLHTIDVPASPVYSLDDVLADNSYRSNGFIQEVDHPVEGTVPVVMGPWLFSETPTSLRDPPPTLDQHGQEIRADMEEGRYWSGGPGAHPYITNW